MLLVEAHPLLELEAFVSEFPGPLGEMATPAALLDLFRPDAAAPLIATTGPRAAVRDLLRHGGFKPTGAQQAGLGVPAQGERPTARLSGINLAVDVCNAVSLHSGLPISVVDLALTTDRFASASPRRARPTSSTRRARASTWAGCCACSTPAGRAPTRSRTPSAPRPPPRRGGR